MVPDSIIVSMLVHSELIGIFNEVLNQTARLRKNRMQATYHCPFCPDKNPVTRKLEIAVGGPDVGSYHCWRCHVGGKSFGTLLRKLNAPSQYRNAVYNLTGDIRIAKQESVDEEYDDVRLPEEFKSMCVPSKNPEYRNALAYLKRRGISEEDMLRYNIGYCEEGEYENHIIIPSYDAMGNLNFFVGRRYYTDDPGIPHKKPEASMNIIGFESFINYTEPLNICEGAFDAIAIRNNAIPLFGKGLSDKLREAIIVNKCKRVNMILDNDAISMAIKNCEIFMRDGVSIYFVELNDKDPSKMGFEKIHQLIRESEEFTQEDRLKRALGL